MTNFVSNWQSWYNAALYARDEYTFCTDAVLGIGGFRNGEYLIPHVNEDRTKYDRRRLLATYYNYPAKIINSYLGALFRHTIDRNNMTPTYIRFVNNANGAGRDISRTMKKAFRSALTVGTVYLVVDRIPITSITRANDALPYIYMRSLKELSYGTFDSVGRLKEIQFLEKMEDGRPAYKTWNAEGWTLSWDKDREAIFAGGFHGLGRVPVVILHGTEPYNVESRLKTKPFIYDIARLTLDVFNAVSELREILRNSTFPVLIYPMDTSLTPDVLPNLMSTGTESAFLYDPKLGGEPKYIAPPSGPASDLTNHINNTIQKIYEMAALQFITGDKVPSGIAFNYMYREVGNLLSDFSIQLEDAETEIAQIVSAYVGEDGSEITVEYPKEFDVVDLQAEIKNSMDALSLKISSTFDSELKKKVARKILGTDTGSETMHVIDQEVDGKTVISMPPLNM